MAGVLRDKAVQVEHHLAKLFQRQRRGDARAVFPESNFPVQRVAANAPICDQIACGDFGCSAHAESVDPAPVSFNPGQSSHCTSAKRGTVTV
jgi:hypothetical protein